MRIHLSEHARKRCRERKIRVAEIKAVLTDPMKDWPSRDAPDRRCYEGIVAGRTVGATVVEGTSPLVVVTVWAKP